MFLAACGDSSDDGAPSLETSSGSTTTVTGLPRCRDVEHAVVFNVFGAATMGDEDEAARWRDDPEAEPSARPGAAEVVRTYRELGYEILYVAAVASDARIGDLPLVDAVTVWLGTNGFPVGEETRVWAPAAGDDPSVALIEELARLSVGGMAFDAGYASDLDGDFSLITGGIPRERAFTVGETEGGGSSTSLPADDFQAHLSDVRALDPVCE